MAIFHVNAPSIYADEVDRNSIVLGF